MNVRYAHELSMIVFTRPIRSESGEFLLMLLLHRTRLFNSHLARTSTYNIFFSTFDCIVAKKAESREADEKQPSKDGLEFVLELHFICLIQEDRRPHKNSSMNWVLFSVLSSFTICSYCLLFFVCANVFVDSACVFFCTMYRRYRFVIEKDNWSRWLAHSQKVTKSRNVG